MFATLFTSITTTNGWIKEIEVFLSPIFQMIIILHSLSHYEIGNGIAYYLRFGTWLTFTLREFCSMSHLYSFDAFAWNISTAFGKKRNKWLTHVWEKTSETFKSLLFCANWNQILCLNFLWTCTHYRVFLASKSFVCLFLFSSRESFWLNVLKLNSRTIHLLRLTI